VNTDWGADRAIAMLAGIAQWLESPASVGFRNHFVIRDLEALALIAGRADLAKCATSIICGLPDSAFTAGIVTNMDDLSRLVRRESTTLAAAEAWFPAYTAQVFATIVERAEAHTAVFGDKSDLHLVRARASSALELEEFASACAVAGRFDDALDALASPDFEPDRRIGPRMAVCVEAFRADRFDIANGLISAYFSTPGHFPLSVAAGLLGRVPWGGYPYPDY
jgi:hypothetical protein